MMFPATVIFVATYRTFGGGHHRVEIPATDYFDARRAARDLAVLRTGPDSLVPGTLAVQEVRQ